MRQSRPATPRAPAAGGTCESVCNFGGDSIPAPWRATARWRRAMPAARAKYTHARAAARASCIFPNSNACKSCLSTCSSQRTGCRNACSQRQQQLPQRLHADCGDCVAACQAGCAAAPCNISIDLQTPLRAMAGAVDAGADRSGRAVLRSQGEGDPRPAAGHRPHDSGQRRLRADRDSRLRAQGADQCAAVRQRRHRARRRGVGRLGRDRVGERHRRQHRLQRQARRREGDRSRVIASARVRRQPAQLRRAQGGRPDPQCQDRSARARGPEVRCRRRRDSRPHRRSRSGGRYRRNHRLRRLRNAEELPPGLAERIRSDARRDGTVPFGRGRLATRASP